MFCSCGTKATPSRADRARRQLPGSAVPSQQDAAARRMQQAGDGFQQRRFAGAVRADDGNDLARRASRGRRPSGSRRRGRSPRRRRRRRSSVIGGGPCRPPAPPGRRPARRNVPSRRWRPSAMTITGSHSAAMVSMWCSISSTADAVGDQRRADARRFRAPSVGLTPATGSSSSSSVGSAIRARPISSSFFCPPDKVRGAVVQHARSGCSRSRNRNRLGHAVRRRGGAPRRDAGCAGSTRSPGWRGRTAAGFPARTGAESRARSGTFAPGRRAVTRSGRQPVIAVPSNVTLPASGRHHAGDAVEQRGLAGAVRADQAGDAPRLARDRSTPRSA